MTEVYLALGPAGWGVYEVDVRDGGPTFRPSNQSPRGILIPGFVDIHCHGAFGADFMSAETSGIEELCDRLWAVGYEAFLPTTVTARAEDARSAIGKLPNHPMIAGFHLEGPFISPKFPGAQPPGFIATPPDGAGEWDPILEDPRLRVVTLAPEIRGGLDLTRRLARAGVTVSLGHSNATCAEARDAIGAGATHVTHTFNAMRPFHHREVGLLGCALIEDALACELIYDRHHVSPEAAALLIRAKPVDRLIAVSDSTMATGLPEGSAIQMWGLDCVVGRQEVRLAENGALAGSAITLFDAFRNLFEDFGPEVAVRACCLNPRAAVGREEVRRWLILDQDLRLMGSL